LGASVDGEAEAHHYPPETYGYNEDGNHPEPKTNHYYSNVEYWFQNRWILSNFFIQLIFDDCENPENGPSKYKESLHVPYGVKFLVVLRCHLD